MSSTSVSGHGNALLKLSSWIPLDRVSSKLIVNACQTTLVCIAQTIHEQFQPTAVQPGQIHLLHITA